MHRRIAPILMLMSILTGSFPATPAYAQQVTLDPGFDPNHVLEDDDIFDVNAMSFDRMVQFLRSKGILATYRTVDTDGVPKTVPEIIWRVATTYKINPKYLLALIQKEQSLVEDPDPAQKQFDWATGYGVCDSCSKDDPSIQEFKGFASQIEWAAKQFREKYLLQILGNGRTRAGKAQGIAMPVDGMTVIPANNATAMLYSYTPHVSGNQNLWRIWRRWFSLKYPDGTVVKASGSGKAYMIHLGQKRAFASQAVLLSLVDPGKIVTVSDTELSSYPDGTKIQFPKFALLRDPEKRIWLLTSDGRRLIQDMKAFHKFSFNEDEIDDVQDADLAEYPITDPITMKTEFPQGVVLQDKSTKTYWYVENNERRRIPNKIFLALYFQGRNIKSVSSKTIAKYVEGDMYRLQNGELVRGKTKSSVFVVEDGLLRPIPSASAFEAFGWKWTNVVTVPDDVMSAYTVGAPMMPETVQPSTTLATTNI